MREYTIELRNGKKSTYHIKELLKADGFHYNNRRWYKKTTDQREINYWKRKRGYQCLVYAEELHQRGNNYRSAYFTTHKSSFGKRYHCSYCGKLLPADALVIDHVIPVQKAKSSRFWQRMLKILGDGDVNSPENLTGACQHCNSRKGARISFYWLLKAFVGKYYLFWVILRLALITFVLWGLWFLYNYLQYNPVL